MKEFQTIRENLDRISYEINGGLGGMLARMFLFALKWLMIGFLVGLGWKLIR